MEAQCSAIGRSGWLAVLWASVSKIVGSIPAVVRHIFNLVYNTKIHKNHEYPHNLRLLDTEIYILFPYRFDFGKSLDKLLIVNKMLRQLYRKPRIGLKDPLYADVWVKLKVFGIRLMCGVFDWHLLGATIIQYLVKYTSKVSHQNLTQLNSSRQLSTFASFNNSRQLFWLSTTCSTHYNL